MAITKKSFKEKCDTGHVYKGNGTRTNAIYFDWQDTPEGRGFKYAVAMDTRNGTKPELLEVLYQWVVNGVEPHYYVRYKYAENDAKRFKVPICLNF